MNVSRATVLVVENEALIALDLQTLLEHEGYGVIGPAGSAAAALKLLEEHDPDVALLDINLGRSDVFDVANELAMRNSGFIFLTGHTMQILPQVYRHRPLVSKPFLPHVLLRAVEDALADRSSLGEDAA